MMLNTEMFKNEKTAAGCGAYYDSTRKKIGNYFAAYRNDLDVSVRSRRPRPDEAPHHREGSPYEQGARRPRADELPRHRGGSPDAQGARRHRADEVPRPRGESPDAQGLDEKDLETTLTT